MMYALLQPRYQIADDSQRTIDLCGDAPCSLSRALRRDCKGSQCDKKQSKPTKRDLLPDTDQTFTQEELEMANVDAMLRVLMCRKCYLIAHVDRSKGYDCMSMFCGSGKRTPRQSKKAKRMYNNNTRLTSSVLERVKAQCGASSDPKRCFDRYIIGYRD